MKYNHINLNGEIVVAENLNLIKNFVFGPYENWVQNESYMVFFFIVMLKLLKEQDSS